MRLLGQGFVEVAYSNLCCSVTHILCWPSLLMFDSYSSDSKLVTSYEQLRSPSSASSQAVAVAQVNILPLSCKATSLDIV